MHVGVADDAALADVRRAGLELGLHERERTPARRGARERGRQRLGKTDERDVAGEERGRERQRRAGDLADVRALHDGHAGILAQAQVDLPVADVERADSRRAGLEQAVGEPARGGTDVEAVLPGHVHAERLERVRELLASAGDEPGSRRDVELGAFVHLLARFRMAGNAPGEHERLRLGPACGQPALDHEDVQPLLHVSQAYGLGRPAQTRARVAPVTFLRILIWWAVNVLGLWVAAWLIDGIEYDGFWWLVFAALVFGLVNLFIRPLLILLTLPVVILTLGLLLLFINAFMLWLVGSIFGDHFVVQDFFWDAILGAIVIWLVNFGLSLLAPQPPPERYAPAGQSPPAVLAAPLADRLRRSPPGRTCPAGSASSRSPGRARASRRRARARGRGRAARRT